MRAAADVEAEIKEGPQIKAQSAATAEAEDWAGATVKADQIH